MYSQPNARRGGLAHYLDGLTLEWVLDGLLGKKSLQSWVVDREAVETLLNHLYRHTGIDAAFLHFFLGEDPYTFASVGDAFAGWLICVDLRRFEKEPGLSAFVPLYPSHSLRKTCGRLLDYLRNRYPETYAQKECLVAARLQAAQQALPEALDFQRESGHLIDSHHPFELVSLDELEPSEIPAPFPGDTYRVEAEALPAVLGFNRLRVRLCSMFIVQSGLPTASSGISLGLRVLGRPDIRLTVQEASGAELTYQRVHLPVNGDWVELFFELKGERDEQVQVEVLHPDATEAVTPMLLPDYFAVRGSSQDTALLLATIDNWQMEIEDPAIRAVFIHLHTHGSLTESELIGLLGSARNARRFAKDFNELVQMLPFSVRIETNSSGKRYVRQE